MVVEVITIGDELISGKVVDNNSAYISRRLPAIGLDVRYHTSVGDNKDDISRVLRRAFNRSQVAIVCGGLGPTVDDITREVVAGYSLLYTWEGADPGAPAVLLMGHLDVVGVEPGTEGDWEHPPFAGESDDRYLWGRGTTDDKGSVIALFEAVEALLAEGFRPDVTLYLAIGHDEEVGGTEGAAALAALLAARGVRLDFVLDEAHRVAY